MIRYWRILLLILMGFYLSGCGGGSDIPGNRMTGAEQQSSSEKIRVMVSEELGGSWKAEVSADGRIQALRGDGIVLPGEREQAARSFLHSKPELFELRKGLSDLRTSRVVDIGNGGTDVFFTQMIQGIPVVNGGTSVHFDRKGNMFLIHPGRTCDATPDLSPSLSAGEALQRLIRKSDDGTGDDLFCHPDAAVKSWKKVFFEKNGTCRLAYEIVAGDSNPRHLMKCYLDADTGELLEARPLFASASGTGSVIYPHPIAASNNQNLSKTDGDAAFTPLYRDVQLRDITYSGGNYSLDGPYVTLKDIEPPENIPPSQAGNIFTCAVSDQFNIRYYPHLGGGSHQLARYGDVMCYFLIDTSQRYIQSLGFTNAANYPIPCDSHGCYDFNNSVYGGDGSGRGCLLFGSDFNGAYARNDHSEDADVVLHEYGHAVLDNQTMDPQTHFSPFGSPLGSTPGVEEGFADYWAISENYAAKVSRGFPPSYYGTWAYKTFGNDEYARNLSNGKTFPEDYQLDPHFTGEIWGGALYDIFQGLGKDTADRLILRSNTLMPSDGCLCFDDAARAVLDADISLYGGSHQAQLLSIFQKRGMLTFSRIPGFAPVAFEAEWIDATTGTRVTGYQGDYQFGYATIPLPFRFSLFGKNFEEGRDMYVFTTGSVHFIYPGLNNIIDPMMLYLAFSRYFVTGTSMTPFSLLLYVDALVTESPGVSPSDSGIYYKTSGSAPNRVFTIQWNKVRHADAPDTPDSYTGSFQVNLYEKGSRIVYCFKDTGFNGAPDMSNGKTAVSALYYDKRKMALLCNMDGTLQNQTAFQMGFPPAAPANLTARSSSAGRIELCWTQNPDDADGFRIERKTAPDEVFEEIAAASGTTYSDDVSGLFAVYTYRVRAYNALGISEYSNEARAAMPSQVSNNSTSQALSQPSSGGGSSRCFIATAAFGSPLAPEVMVLRNFREKYLQTNAPGRAFVAFYYSHSPAIARWISGREWARLLIRLILMPVAGVALILLKIPLWTLAFCLMMIAISIKRYVPFVLAKKSGSLRMSRLLN